MFPLVWITLRVTIPFPGRCKSTVPPPPPDSPTHCFTVTPLPKLLVFSMDKVETARDVDCELGLVISPLPNVLSEDTFVLVRCIPFLIFMCPQLPPTGLWWWEWWWCPDELGSSWLMLDERGVIGRNGDEDEQSIETAWRRTGGGTLFRNFGRQEDLLAAIAAGLGTFGLDGSSSSYKFGADGHLWISSSFELDCRTVL